MQLLCRYPCLPLLQVQVSMLYAHITVSTRTLTPLATRTAMQCTGQPLPAGLHAMWPEPGGGCRDAQFYFSLYTYVACWPCHPHIHQQVSMPCSLVQIPSHPSERQVTNVSWLLGVTRRKLQTPGTAEEHKRQERPTINPIDRQPTHLTDQAPCTIERAARETHNTN